MADPHGIQMKELTVGDVYMVASPKRVVKVIGHTTVQVLVKRQEVGGEISVKVARDAIKLVGTIITLPIPGMVSERDAKVGMSHRNSVYKASGDMDVADTVWEEIWTDRAVPERDTAPGKVAKLMDDKPSLFFLQTYCESTTRAQSRERTSPIAGSPIGPLKFVPEKSVPEGLFMTEKELRDAEILSDSEVEPETLPRNIMVLKALCKNRGLDIDGIPKGPGRVDRVIQYIRDAGKPDMPNVPDEPQSRKLSQSEEGRNNGDPSHS